MSKKILILAGDGIGPEVIVESRKVLDAIGRCYQTEFEFDSALVGGAALDATGVPLPDETLSKCRNSDAILFGAIGGPKWDEWDRELRPEKGLIKLRGELDLFCNLRPAILYPQLASASTLKPEIVADLDIMIVRELTGGIYFGEPRGIRSLPDGGREGFNTLKYSSAEIQRIGEMAFETAIRRNKRVCSVDKANILDSSVVWREEMTELAADFPDVELTHMYVDNAAMQLVREPKQFDVIVTGNMFGDILSDAAAMLTGSLGMMPSASLNADGLGMYEPIHGTAPDIAGQNKANPLATILSASMMLRHSFDMREAADAVESAIGSVLDQGLRTGDIMADNNKLVSTSDMGDAVVRELES